MARCATAPAPQKRYSAVSGGRDGRRAYSPLCTTSPSTAKETSSRRRSIPGSACRSFAAWICRTSKAAPAAASILAPADSCLYKRRHLTRGPWLCSRPVAHPDREEGRAHGSAAAQPEKKMAVPEFSMRQLLEAGVHFGHQAHRWNPKMAEYIFGTRNNIHVIDLAQTVPMMHRALQAVSDTVAKGGRILFVGTKRQAQD